MIQKEIQATLKGKKTLVTGGTGMIGRQVVELLVKGGAQVRIVSLDRIVVNDQAEHVYGDLTEFSFCRDMTENIDYVFHLAGVGASVDASKTKIASHFVPTMMMNSNILEACRINGVQKTVYTSSIGAYAAAEIFIEAEDRLDSNPMDFAGWAKRMGEAQIYAYKRQYNLDNFAIVRPSNVYGPGDNFDPSHALVIPSLVYRIARGENPLAVWGDGSAVRDFVYSGDVALGIVQALYFGTGSTFVNLGSGVPISISELLETLRSFIDFEFYFDPSKPTGAPKRLMDISLARKIIHYHPSTTLKEGLMKTWAWFMDHRGEHLAKKSYFETD